MIKEHTSEEIKYRLSDLGAQIGSIAIKYITDLEKQIKELQEDLDHKKIALKSRKARIKELENQIEKMKVCSNCKHFNKVDDLEYCHNCERQLVNSLDKLPREEIIKDEWELSE